MKLVFQQMARLWRELAWGPRIVLCGTALAVVAGMMAMIFWAHRPQYKLLYGRLGQKEAGEVVAAVQAQGIPYELGGDGTAIYVPADQVYKVRMDLASKGLPGGDGVGFEIFDKSNFGISDFIQRTNYMRALQGELARTISQLKGIRSARVLIATPEHRLLLKSAESRTTASVMVETGGSLEAGAVNSIRSLVANAVEGLNVNDVAVVDNRGNVLSDELKDDGMGGGANGMVKYRKQVEDYLAGKVETMLAKVLGTGQAVVRVSAEINMDGATMQEEKYDPESQIARNETTTEDTTATTERTAAEKAAGVAANTPADNAGEEGSTPSRSSQESRKSVTHTYELNRITTSTTKNAGNVTRVSAAVFLAQRAAAPGGAATPRTADEMMGLRRMIANALGITAPKPADLEALISVQETPFPATSEPAKMTADQISGYVESARPLLGFGMAALALFVFMRWLKRTKPDDIAWEILPEQQALPTSTSLATAPTARSPKVSPELLNELIRQKPENVGATLRNWLATKE